MRIRLWSEVQKGKGSHGPGPRRAHKLHLLRSSDGPLFLHIWRLASSAQHSTLWARGYPFQLHYFLKKKKKEKKGRGQGWNSLAVQWLGLGAFTAVARVQSLVREIRSHKSHDKAKKEKKVFFPRAVATNNHKLNVLNIYFLTFMEARILKSSCWQSLGF